MEFKVGQLVRSKINNKWIRGLDIGKIIQVNTYTLWVDWENPNSEQTSDSWSIGKSDVEPAYRKSEMEGNYLKVLKDSSGELSIGNIIKITLDGYYSFLYNSVEYSTWADDLPDIFTQSDLLNLYGGSVDFKYILASDLPNAKPQTKVKPKSKVKELVVPIKVEFINKDEIKNFFKKPVESKPMIEETDEELIIYCGRNTIYYSKSYDSLGMSTCNPNDNYDKFVGKAVAYFRAMNK